MTYEFVLNAIQGSPLMPMRGRRVVLGALDVILRPGALAWHSIYFGRGAELGENSMINAFCYVDQQVSVGRNVRIGVHAKLLTSQHRLGPPEQRCHAAIKVEPVRIGDGCWIGAGVTILPGVEVAPGCVIAAGAVVTRSTEPNGLYTGLPARRVRDLPLDGPTT